MAQQRCGARKSLTMREGAGFEIESAFWMS